MNNTFFPYGILRDAFCKASVFLVVYYNPRDVVHQKSNTYQSHIFEDLENIVQLKIAHCFSIFHDHKNPSDIFSYILSDNLFRYSYPYMA